MVPDLKSLDPLIYVDWKELPKNPELFLCEDGGHIVFDVYQRLKNKFGIWD